MIILNNPFFNFKKETFEAIKEVISQYEGVEKEKVNEYIRVTHAYRIAQLIGEFKDLTDIFVRRHPELSLSDLTGIIQTIMFELQLKQSIRGEQYIQQTKMEGKKR